LIFTLGKKTFKTKKAAGEEVRRVLHSTELGKKLEGEEHDLVRALLSLHPQATQKVGVGVIAIYVRDGGWNSRCFWVRRADGSETDFSYRECFTPSTHQQQVLAAMRRAIFDQVLEFKNQKFSGMVKIRCEASDELIGPDECDVDHFDPTFRQIVDDFFQTTGWNFENIRVRPTADGQLGDELADSPLSELWQAFHNTKAKLRIVTKKINQTRRSA
jgi:Protein of unknown function (DUF3223)